MQRTQPFLPDITTMFPILWLTGNSGAGKTTLAEAFENYWNDGSAGDHPFARRVLVLDGDEMRATISVGESLSAEDRRTHNLRVARLALLIQKKGFLVVVAVIAPFASVRHEISLLCKPQWIYIKRNGLSAPDRPYEVPKHPTLTIDNDLLTKKEGLRTLLSFMRGYETGTLMKKRKETKKRAGETYSLASGLKK